MSDVEEAPAQVVSTPWGDRMDARVHGMGDGLSVLKAVGTFPTRVLFARAARVVQDDLDAELGGRRNLPTKWADSLDDTVDVGDNMEVSENDTSLLGGRLGLPRLCNGTCGEKIDAFETTLDRFAKMVEMLVAAGGLSSPAAGLVVEKHKGKMAREWDESVSQASKMTKAEMVVRAAEKRVHKKAEEEKKAEEAWVQQEKVVQVKEGTSLAAAGERDRMEEAARGCTDGPAMVATAEKVVEAARVVMALQREVA